MAMKKKVSLPISDRHISNLAQAFKLLADDSRLKILLVLAREGEMHVSALCDMLGQSQPAVSHHLTLLRMAGLVSFRRDGKFNFYSTDGLQLGTTLEEIFSLAGRANKIDFKDFALTYSRNKRR